MEPRWWVGGAGGVGGCSRDGVRAWSRPRHAAACTHHPAGFKVGMCAQAPLHQPYSLLALSNNSSIVGTLQAGRDRFAHLFRVRAHAHHYTEFMGQDDIAEAIEALDGLVGAYRKGEAMG